MRAAPEGPGWWQASDGQWYPPELHPAVLAGDRSVEDLRAAPITGRADRTTIRWVAETTTEPEPAPEPEPEPAQAWGPEPEPVQAWEPEPEPVQAWEPEPEPAQAWEPEPEPTWEPEWEPEPEPAPVRAVAAVGPAPSPSPTAPPPIPGAEDFGPERPSRFLLLGVAAAALALIAISAFTFLTNRDEASEPAAEGAGSVDTTASSSPPPDTDTAPTDTDTPGTETTAPAVTVAPVLAQVADLEEGDCLANPDLGLGDPTAMALADCDGPHTHEVFLTADFQPIDDAFDLAALQVFAAETCEAGFEAFVGEPYVSSRYLYVALGPTRDSWAAGERGIACLIYDPRGEVSGTLRGVGS
jgi:hypothetical protein